MHEIKAHTLPSPGKDMTLGQAIARLSAHPMVDGILTIGSTGTDELSPASDYDLVLVLAEMPAPLLVGLTTIDGRIADILFVTRVQITQVLDLCQPVDGDAWIGRIVRWLQAGQIAFDRTGQIEQAQQKVRDGNWLQAKDARVGYGHWFSLNYNLAQTQRLLASDDPLYLAAGELRMQLYGPSDLLFGYWEIRGLRWEGDKPAVRYLLEHDPDYWRLFCAFTQETDRHHKFALYERLAKRTAVPAGGLWPPDATAVQFDSRQVTPEVIEIGLRFLEELLANPPTLEDTPSTLEDIPSTSEDTPSTSEDTL